MGGEEVMFENICRILSKKRHDLYIYEKKSENIIGLKKKINAFFSGIYSWSTKKELVSILTSNNFDIAHVHNIYPLISPSALGVFREFNIPVVIRCADFRIISCPISTHMRKNTICELCRGGKEYWCIINNCRNNLFESTGYALRNFIARKFDLIKNNVSYFIPPSSFVKKRMIDAGFSANRIIVIPNVVKIPKVKAHLEQGKYIAFAGRISSEKGIYTLLQAARITGLPVRIAGDYSKMPDIINKASANVSFLGHLDRDRLNNFYRQARFLVVPSIALESFGLVIIDAMSYGLPVVASRIAGPMEIVEEGVTGLLFQAGDPTDLAEKIRNLWTHPDLCRQMGQAGREKAIREYSEDVYYKRLMAVYKKAIAINKDRKRYKAKS